MVNYDAAKEIFRKYYGSHYEMVRENAFKEYDSYQVPKAVETRWFHEMKSEILSKLATEANRKSILYLVGAYAVLVSESKDKEGVLTMVRFLETNCDEFDTLTNVRIVEWVFYAIRFLKSGQKLKIMKQMLEILKTELEKSITFSDDFREDAFLRHFLSTDKIVEQIKRVIRSYSTEIGELEPSLWDSDRAAKIEDAAKAIFRKYSGSHFHMAQEGDLEDYKVYQVPKHIEAEWYRELKSDTLSKLKTETNRKSMVDIVAEYSRLVWASSDKEGVLTMIRFLETNCDTFDTLTNVRMIECVFYALRFSDTGEEIKIAEQMLERLKAELEKPSTVSDDYKVGGILSNCFSTDEVVERIKRDISYYSTKIEENKPSQWDSDHLAKD